MSAILGTIIGSAILGGASLIGGERRNKKAASEAQTNRKFQAFMSSTAYRRAMNDLGKAGLNPILAAGQPASTPGGAQADVQDTITPALQTALGTATTATQLDNTNANTDLLIENTHNAVEQNKEISARAREANANAEIAEGRAKVFRDDPTLHSAREYSEIFSNPFSTAGGIFGKGQNNNKSYNPTTGSDKADSVLKKLYHSLFDRFGGSTNATN